VLPEDYPNAPWTLSLRLPDFFCPTVRYLEDLVAILVVGMLVKYAGTLAATASSQTSNPNIFHLGDTGDTRPCAMED
jgi:hypothetical protein